MKLQSALKEAHREKDVLERRLEEVEGTRGQQESLRLQEVEVGEHWVWPFGYDLSCRSRTASFDPTWRGYARQSQAEMGRTMRSESSQVGGGFWGCSLHI